MNITVIIPHNSCRYSSEAEDVAHLISQLNLNFDNSGFQSFHSNHFHTINIQKTHDLECQFS